MNLCVCRCDKYVKLNARKELPAVSFLNLQLHLQLISVINQLLICSLHEVPYLEMHLKDKRCMQVLMSCCCSETQ